MRVPLLMATACACGDVGDVKIPIPGAARPSGVPEFPPIAARASAAIDVGGAAPACPLELHAILPSVPPEPSATRRSSRDRVDPDGAHIECRVSERIEAPLLFDVDLLLEHDVITRFALQGAMSERSAESVSVQIAALDGTTIEADCSAEASTLLPGAVSFRLPGCTTRPDGPAPVGCSVEVEATFEYCER